jgi:hypothetical protein
MQLSARQLVLIIFASLLSIAGLQVTTATAQDAAGNAAVIHSANTDIIFEHAGMKGLPSARYQAFDEFATEHPQIARALARNPRLIENESFVRNYPAWSDFLRTHPDVAHDFAENPGNYVDMPLTVAASIKKNPIEPQ